MTVNEFLDLCNDRSVMEVTIFDFHRGRDIWHGAGCEVPNSIGEAEVKTFDSSYGPNCLTINIEGEKEINMMTVNEFLDMCCDRGLLKVTIYNTTSEKDIWSGQGDEVPDSMGDMTVESFDAPANSDCMTLKVSGGYF